MENIHIAGSHDGYFVPTVDFNYQNGICDISGESFLEETNVFYAPLISWIREYVKTGLPLIFNCKLTYFNTSSTKSLLDIFKILKKYELDGGQVAVNWYYDNEDLDLEEAIQDYITDTGLKINMINF